MKLWPLIGMALLIQVPPPALSADSAVGGQYRILASIPGPDGMWDYAAIDAPARHLYLAQGDHISLLDLKAGGAWTSIGVPAAMWHGVVPMESRGVILGTNGQAHTVTVFDSKSHAVLKSIPTSTGPKSVLSGRLARFAALADPDAIAIEPKSGLIAAVNGGSGEVVLIDLDSGATAGKVEAGGKLEFIVADGAGVLYVNVQTTHEIAVIDVANRKVTRRIALRDCVEPKGLAYDAPMDMLVSVCDNGVAKFMAAKTGAEIASLAVGTGADAVIVDERRRRAFVPSAQGSLSVFDLHEPKHIRLVQTLATEKGTRLGALDPNTGMLYLPAGKLGPPIAPHPWPSVVSGTFHVLVVGLGQE